MGDPRKIRAKYKGPGHPWNKARIEEEKTLLSEYGLRNKTELWRVLSKLKSAQSQAKKLIAASGSQADKERGQLMQRLQRLGLIKAGTHLDDVLGLTVKDFLNRRLQTVVHKKGLSRSIDQARQFITHRHITCAGKKITAQSYLVTLQEEPNVDFIAKSSLASPEHAERKPAEKKPIAKAEEKDEEKRD